jgi:hypothetical protein
MCARTQNQSISPLADVAPSEKTNATAMQLLDGEVELISVALPVRSSSSSRGGGGR